MNHKTLGLIMYQVVLEKISELSKQSLPAAVWRQAPEGKHRSSWLAGRVLLSRMFPSYLLPEIVYDTNGKPRFPNDISLWFNISHSGDHIVLFISDEGEVGCDIEVIRPRKNWPHLVSAVFSSGEQKEIDKEQEDRQLAAFWRIWTRKEAIVKQSGGIAQQIVSVDSTRPGQLFLNHCQSGELSLAVCTSTPFSLNYH